MQCLFMVHTQLSKLKANSYLTCLSILGECFLISSLPGKALRMHADISRLAERFNMRSLKVEPGKPGILFISLPIVSLHRAVVKKL